MKEINIQTFEQGNQSLNSVNYSIKNDDQTFSVMKTVTGSNQTQRTYLNVKLERIENMSIYHDNQVEIQNKLPLWAFCGIFLLIGLFMNVYELTNHDGKETLCYLSIIPFIIAIVLFVLTFRTPSSQSCMGIYFKDLNGEIIFQVNLIQMDDSLVNDTMLFFDDIRLSQFKLETISEVVN